MRVFVVHNHYQEPGGEDVVFESEVALVRTAGHTVETWERTNNEINHWGTVRKAQLLWRTSWSPDSYSAVRQQIRSFRPDVVHVHNTLPLISPAVYYACRAERVPVVQTLHNYRLLCAAGSLLRAGAFCDDCVGRFPAQAILSRCYRGSAVQSAAVAGMQVLHRGIGTWARAVTSFIALTDFGRRLFIRGGLPAERIRIKPNFVDDPGPPQPLGDYALAVGRLVEYKGLRTLLKAWTGPNSPELPLRIVGDGPMREEARAYLREHPGARIELLGALPRGAVTRELSSARFLVVPSVWSEACPLVVIEGFAAGRPVLASGHGALAELVEDGSTGRLFAPGDAGALAQTARELAADQGALEEMGARARARYLAEYTPERNLHQLLSIYGEARARVERHTSVEAHSRRAEGRSHT